MKIFKVILFVVLLAGSFNLTAQSNGVSVSTISETDSLKYASLDKKLDEYCIALRYEPVGVQIEECDFLIETCKDSLVRQYVALTLYEKYRTSKIMGVEGVAIHILDKWFFSGAVKFDNEIEQLDARIYADFNRQSLVGTKAPEITMFKKDGTCTSLFEPDEVSHRFRVLFFYDVQCAKCKVETILLRNMLENEDFPVDFYAIYTGGDEKGWEDYISGRLDVHPISAEVIHLWDPECDSDFQRKYGILQTPKLFLVAPDNTILGRNLDAKSLIIMLKSVFQERSLEYGTEESVKLLDNVLGSKEVTVDEIGHFADQLAKTALPKGDTLMFRQMSGDLLYYLSSKSTESAREGLDYLIDNYILSRPEIWKSEDDSLKIIGMAMMMDDLLKKSKPGTKISELKVPAELYTWKSVKKGKYRMDKLRGRRNIIIFYTDGCANCDAQKKAATDFLALKESAFRREVRHTNVLMVNVDEILSGRSQLATDLFDFFDLSTLPYILLTDSRGVILRRYISLI